MNKLRKSTLPSKHTKDDFKCFGPPAICDGKFDGTIIADLGCFRQGQVDSNKYYHGAVVQSTINNEWYAYFEHGRTGSTTNPQFQFIECNSKNEAEACYRKQIHSKNDKRGIWVDHQQLGRILQPKPGKDCYLVRPQATRSTGLPDAKTITVTPQNVKIKSTKSKKTNFDPLSTKLLSDLDMGTMQYTRSSMATDSLPTMDAVEECRKICDEATKICNKLKTTKRIIESGDLIDLTNLMYGRIPKKKGKQAEKVDWLLTPENIQSWNQDLDAFESALKTQEVTEVMHDYPFFLEHVTPDSELGKFLNNWFLKATRNRHSYINNAVKIKNIWKITNDKDWILFRRYRKGIKENANYEQPLHQVSRTDLDHSDHTEYKNSGTWMLFHGTRTVNVSGILRESLKLPKELSSVAITGSAFGNGTYWSDDYKKSIGYTSYKNSYWSHGSGKITGRDSFMFIGDVCLGNPWIAPRSGGYKGPPSGYNSIFGKAGHSGVQNNEFITFDPASVYLRYLVEFV